MVVLGSLLLVVWGVGSWCGAKELAFDLALELSFPSGCEVGMPQPAHIALTNRGSETVMVERIRSGPPNPSLDLNLVRHYPGKLEPREDGTLQFNTMAQQISSQAFYLGLLRPGETVRATIRYRVLQPTERFVVTLWRVDPETLARVWRRVAASPGGVTFGTGEPAAGSLDESSREWVHDVPTKIPDRAVIFTEPPSATPQELVLRRSVGCGGQLNPDLPTIQAELSRRGIRPEYLSWSGRFNSWVVETGERSLLVSPGKEPLSLPLLPWSLLDDIDTREEVPFMPGSDAARELLARWGRADPSTVEGEERYLVPVARCPDLLKLIARRGGGLGPHAGVKGSFVYRLDL
jgi:hypothetical protein